MKATLFLRCFVAILLTIAIGALFSFFSFVFVASGGDPESIQAAEAVIPYLALFLATMSTSRPMTGQGWKSWWILPVVTAGFFTAAWLWYWCYVSARYDFTFWRRYGVVPLAPRDWLALALSLPASLAGAALCILLTGRSSQIRRVTFVGVWFGALMTLVAVQIEAGISRRTREGPYGRDLRIARGVTLRCEPILPDGTTVRLITCDFAENPGIRVRLYDCTVDSGAPEDDNNTIYWGLPLQRLAATLEDRESAGRRVFTLCNGGFFGDHGLRVADHVSAVVVDGAAHYNVDLVRPRDQSWFFGVTSDERRAAGEPRFQLLESTPWDGMGTHFQTAIGGARPLRVAGESRELAPGAGSTRLRCSRTSVGWSADGNRFYLLIVHDPDSEFGSNMQKRFGWKQTGGWDVREVQQFWERMQVPNAVLFDGGDSTQLACRDKAGGMSFLGSGAYISLPLGYWNERPLRALLPFLPPSLEHHGVLNYLYVEGTP